MTERELTSDEIMDKLWEDRRKELEPSHDDNPVIAALKRMQLTITPAQRPRATQRTVPGELTPQEVLVNLFDSDACPVDEPAGTGQPRRRVPAGLRLPDRDGARLGR
jgi:hypothetical protein